MTLEANREFLRKKLDLVVTRIDNRVFEFGKSFPHSKKVEHFTRLEGRTFRKDPKDIRFKDYAEKWWAEMYPGMSASQARDYTSILKAHLLPYFGELSFSEFRPVLMKKFLAQLKAKRTPGGTPLSAKRIHNIMIPLRVIVTDAAGNTAGPICRTLLPGSNCPRSKGFVFTPSRSGSGLN